MGKWKEVNEAVPQHVVQVLPIDKTGKVLIMHRSDKVRSAKNVWSLPSGMHEIGETIEDTAKRELLEEYDLEATQFLDLGTYENIAGDDEAEEQYHWVINVVAALVEDVSLAVNKEPEKHDKMEFVYARTFSQLGFTAFPFHKSFQDWMEPRRAELYARLKAFVKPLKEESHEA